MSSFFSTFVIVGALGSLLAFFLILQMNNRTSNKPGQTTGHQYDGIEEFDNPLPAWWYWGFIGDDCFRPGLSCVLPGAG